MPTRAAALLSLFVPLAGCAGSTGDYPSLAPRDIETRAVFAEPARDAMAAPRDAALDARVVAVLAQVDEGERGFATALAALPGGTAPAFGSEAWIAAQLVLTALDAARQPVTEALATLDALRLEAAQRASAVDTTALDAAYARAAASAERQRVAWQAAADRLPAG